MFYKHIGPHFNYFHLMNRLKELKLDLAFCKAENMFEKNVSLN